MNLHDELVRPPAESNVDAIQIRRLCLITASRTAMTKSKRFDSNIEACLVWNLCGSMASDRSSNLSSSYEEEESGLKTKGRNPLLSLSLIFLALWLISESEQVMTRAVHASLDERINVAAAANGGIATASSFQEQFPIASAIDGDRKGLTGQWRDATTAFPDWLQVDFEGVKAIDEVNVITLQDAWWNPVEPTETLVFHNNGLTSFEVQYWNGNDFVTIPGVTVTNNNKVWRRFTFQNVTTDKIRLFCFAARFQHSILVEIEAWGVPVVPNPDPTPTPTPPPFGSVEAALAARDIHFDQDNNVGFGTTVPVFNDDGTTGAFVGKFVAIDGRLTGAAAYLGLGGNIPNPGDRVGLLNFYNMAMGGVDNRTASILSFNGPTLGTGTLEFATSPNIIGPVRRMQIAPTGEVGINHLASPGATLTVMGRSTGATTHALSVVDGADRGTLTVRDDGQVFVSRPGQGIVLRSPNGFVCRKLVINDNGELLVQHMPSCP